MAKLSQKEIINFYRENVERLFKFFYYKTLSREIAEDLTSETFISLVKILKDENEVRDTRAFLYGIAKNVFLQYLRNKYQEGIPFSEFERDFENYAEKVVETIENKPTIEEIANEYIKLLPEKQRIVLHLRFIEKLNLKEIALKLEKDMNYVKTTQKRGLANLKKYYELSS